MRYYFHISNDYITAEDHEGMDLPTCLAALEEGGKIADELLRDPDTTSFHGGVVNIVGSGGWVFISLPIANPGETPATVLN
jgi:hypothetical protein